MTCPNCHGDMTAMTLEAHQGRQVTIDLCHACQAFWFDGYESLQLAPASVLRLFRAIGEQGRAAAALSDRSRCPRCGLRLVPTHDRQRQTAFEYLRCPQRHGRLISFFNFLREKDFIRPLSPAQIAELRQNVQTVNCSNCGAPVDLAAGAACAHCGSPLSMLDLGQAEALVARLQGATAPAAKEIDPALPFALEQARREVAAAFAEFEREPGWYQNVSSAGLVGAALGSIARWWSSRR
jgi:hypothetical protein